MSQKTDIQWCDSTINPTTGCDGCELWVKGKGGPCYAGNLHEGRLARSLPNLYAPDFQEVRLAPGRMVKAAGWPDLTGIDRPGKPWLDRMPRLIFVSDLGDLFSKDVPFSYIKSEVIDVVRSVKGRRHIWMLLTKLPRRMLEFAEWLRFGCGTGDIEQAMGWPANVWAGTSITTARTLKRVESLRKVPARVRYLSVEPQLESIDLTCAISEGISLVIQGGESDQRGHAGRPFNVGWARTARDQCRASGVKYFLKQVGSHPYVVRYDENSTTDPGDEVPVKLHDHHGANWDEWAVDLRIREMPEVTYV